MPIQNRAGNHLTTGVAERDQMSGEIAAVHRGYVLGFQRPQIPGAVPVVEMPAELLHPLHCVERRAQPLDGFMCSDPAEIVSRDH